MEQHKRVDASEFPPQRPNIGAHRTSRSSEHRPYPSSLPYPGQTKSSNKNEQCKTVVARFHFTFTLSSIDLSRWGVCSRFVGS
jgi:hypothetical protein